MLVATLGLVLWATALGKEKTLLMTFGVLEEFLTPVKVKAFSVLR